MLDEKNYVYPASLIVESCTKNWFKIFDIAIEEDSCSSTY